MAEKKSFTLAGLTGGTGSGKSTAARYFRELGARIIDADRMGHDLLKSGSPCYEAVLKAFSPGIAIKGRISRKELGKIVFGNKREMKKLNRIVHPHILNGIKDQISKIKKSGFKGLVVVDAALIVPWGLQNKLDHLIVVEAPVKIRLERLVADGLSLDRARKIMASQLPVAKLKREGDLIIINGGSLSSLQQKVKKIHETLGTQRKTDF
ncbi:dephospho-CoA kinase [candidate division TA06 bacterium]|uniref:Dephospho-CoA kinase n=1 Tax=candidate division TA06 bacterium TaxID=2250710 RepID=A0A933MHU4_UNCT6|nr:dephospho-CoA kinase [candidate division TA06 bacterium]